jgi:putative phage-type endonuclease
MKTLNLIQGSQKWHEHRRTHFNASDAPAMLGVSPYKTRTELLHEIATGIVDAEIDEATLRRFADGHRFEALARPLAEEIIGDSLSPTVGVSGKLSASFDGITFDELVIFEHKTFNCSLKDITDASQLPEQYRVQMEQQLMVSGASKCLFMASKWDGDQLDKEMHVWYEPDMALRERIEQGWKQFQVDLANYAPPEYIPAAVATPTKDLPALSIQVNGSVSLISNLEIFGARLDAFVKQIDKEPNDDQGFADAEAAIKTLQKAEDALEASESSALAQTASIDDMRKTVKLHKDTARTTRLLLEKMVKERKKSIKLEVIQEGKDAYAQHVEAINKRLGKPYLPQIHADFAGAVSGAKSIKGLRERMKNELLRVQLESTAVANKIDANLSTLRESAKDHAFLFADTGMLVLKENEDLVTLIKVRISEHEQAVAAKQAAEREQIRIEEEAKAKAKVEAEALAAKLKIEHEAQHQESLRVALEAEAEKAKRIQDDLDAAKSRRAKVEAEQAEVVAASTVAVSANEFVKPTGKNFPGNVAVTNAIMEKFGISVPTAYAWCALVADSQRVAA